MPVPKSSEFIARFPNETQSMLAILRTGSVEGVAIAACADLSLRPRLMDYLRRCLERDGIYTFNFEVSSTDINLARSLQELAQHPRFKNLELSGKYKAIVIFIYGLEKFEDKQLEQFISLLNFLRERLVLFGRPLVLWATSELAAKLAQNAPDFWQQKSHFFSFVSPEEDTGEPKGELDLPPLQRYLRRILEDRDFTTWKKFYLPLKANRAAEAITPFPTNHTLTYAEFRQLARLLPNKPEAFAAHEVIFHRGEPGDKCYVIVNGEVEVLAPSTLGNDIVISKLGKGDFFGEIALLKGIPRTATVRTTKPSKFAPLTHQTLSTLSHKAPEVLEILADIGQRRLEKRTQDPQEPVSPLRRFGMAGASLIREAPIDVRELIATDRRTVILGEAGAGKTTVLRRLMLEAAREADHAHGRGEPFVLPFFLKLNTLSPGKSLEQLLCELFSSYGLSEFKTEADISHLLTNEPSVQSVLFLLDGFNEMPAPEQTRAELSRFIRSYPTSRFILSCRAQDYAPLHGFYTAMLQRLSGEDAEAFLVNYLEPEQGRKVAREIYSDSQLEDLAQTPLALYMFARIVQRSREALPKNRGLLFEVFTTNLLERTDNEWWQAFGRRRAKTPLPLRRRILARLGLTMQEEETWTFTRHRWNKLLAEELDHYTQAAPPSERVSLKHITSEEIHAEIKHSGLLLTANDETWLEFAHQTYQEFFAALALQNRAYDLDALLQTAESRQRWRDTLILLYGIAQDKPALYRKILGEEHDYARIWLASQCLANSGEEITAALKNLKQRLPLTQYFGLLFSIGLAARQLGRYSEALSYLNMATEQDPGSAEVRYELGCLYRLADQYERAIIYLGEAIHLRPDFVDAYNQLGITYHDQHKYEEALTVFKETIRLEPGNPYHFYNLGAVQKIRHDYNAARETFRTALELKPDYSEAKDQLDLLEQALESGAVRLLEHIPILSKMSLEQSLILEKRSKSAKFKQGQIVFHMGEMGDTFYIIEAGEVEVLAPDLGGRSGGVINRLGPNDFFGEIALLVAVPRTATIRATKPTRLLKISREDFDTVMARFPAVAHRLAETSSLRLLHDRHLGRRVDLNRYYDPGYIAELTQQNEVTVVMGDIHGSTHLTNAIGPELMVAFLDEYLLRMSRIIVEAGGAIDKSLGDSVMGVFGNFPKREGKDEAATAAHACLLAALRMREAYLILRNEWKQKSHEFAQTGMGIGVSTGKVTTGTVGAETTMVGPAVNLSNKLSKMAINGRTESEVYVDTRTRELLGDAFENESLDLAYTQKRVGVQLDAYRIIQRRP